MPRSRVNSKLLMAVYHGRNYARDGKYVVNRIGTVSYTHLTLPTN